MTVALGLLVASGTVLLIAAGRTWLRGNNSHYLQGQPFRVFDIKVPEQASAHGVGLLLLASAVAVLATRGGWRTAVGVVALLAALWISGLVLLGDLLTITDGETGTGWPVVAFGSGLLGVWGAVLVVRRGSGWPSMSNRYERGARAAAKPTNAWDVIDRGGDPTA